MFPRSCTSLLVFLLAVSATQGVKNKKTYFRFEDCSPKNGIADVEKFEMKPDPVDMRRNMTNTVLVNLKSDLSEKAMLKTRYYKIKDIFGVKIDVPIFCFLGKFGSCTLPLCEYLDLFRDQIEPMYGEGQEYGCPVKAGRYGGQDVETPIPDIGDIGRYIVKGRYRTELTLLDKPNGKVLACYKIWTELK